MKINASVIAVIISVILGGVAVSYYEPLLGCDSREVAEVAEAVDVFCETGGAV